MSKVLFTIIILKYLAMDLKLVSVSSGGKCFTIPLAKSVMSMFSVSLTGRKGSQLLYLLCTLFVVVNMILGIV